MARIRSVDVNEARSRLRGVSERRMVLAPLREAISRLTDATVLELTPDDGENLRTLKRNITLAAREAGRSVAYGVTAESTLLVWLETTRSQRHRRRAKTGAAI